MNIPVSYKTIRFFDIGKEHNYYDDFHNNYRVKRMVERVYLPANKMIKKMIDRDSASFCFSISGITLRLMEIYSPELIESFRELANTGRVEFLATPYHHSPSALVDMEEFKTQTSMHIEKINKLFSQKPKTFVNTGMIYFDALTPVLHELGIRCVFTEGAKHVLGWKSPNYVYRSPGIEALSILTRDVDLSNEIQYEFSNVKSESYPITAESFTDKLLQKEKDLQSVLLSFDYRAFGDLHVRESGIFDFFEALPFHLEKKAGMQIQLPSEIMKASKPVGDLYVPSPISFYGNEKDSSLIQGNELQKEAILQIYKMKEKVLASNNQVLIKKWRVLQEIENFLLMNPKSRCTLFDKHTDLSSYQAFINYMNIVSDLQLSIQASLA